MTFIIAIQLEDSIIIAADKRSVTLDDNGKYLNHNDKDSKFYLWDNGIIVGSGEHTVIQRAFEFFTKLAQSDIKKLPRCLTISRMLRELEAEHFQINTTSLIYSDYTEQGIQLFLLEPNEINEYKVEACEVNSIVIWLFDPNAQGIAAVLKKLYSKLRPRRSFKTQNEWFDHYINELCETYRIQAQQDPAMSSNFNYLFQSQTDYILGYIPNTHNNRLTFDSISTDL